MIGFEECMKRSEEPEPMHCSICNDLLSDVVVTPGKPCPILICERCLSEREAKFGNVRARIRQIEQKALRRLRDPS
jgi:hypothetical protein